MRPIRFAAAVAAATLALALIAPASGLALVLPASVTDPEPDDNIGYLEPLALDSSGSTTVVGTLEQGVDIDDLHRVLFRAGEQVSIVLELGTGQFFSLRLYPPDASDIYTDAPIRELSLGPPSFGFNHEMPETGLYPIDVRTGMNSGGSGSYTLHIDVTRPQGRMALSPPHEVAFADTATVEGTVTPRFGAIGRHHVYLYGTFDDGLSWWPRSVSELDDAGAFSFKVPFIYEKTYFNLVCLGDGWPDMAPCTGTTYVTSKARLSKVSATRLGTRRYRLNGLLEPPHAGTHAARIYLWHYENGKYKAHGYQKAYCYDTACNYRLTTTLPHKGKWRLQAYHADAGHLTTRGSYSYMTAK